MNCQEIIIPPVKSILKPMGDVASSSGTNIVTSDPFDVLNMVEKDVDNDSENQGAGNLGQRDRTDVHSHSADTGDQDDRSGKEVSIIIQINRLKHFQT